MSFLKNIFSSKEEPINNYNDFWNWFKQHEKTFHKAVKNQTEIEKTFFNKLSPKLGELRDGYYFLAGMLNENTAELVLTADGAIKNIGFVEELVKAAPEIEGWKFTALKPALNVNDVEIQMAGYKFSSDQIDFYYNEDLNYPDEIDVVIVNNELNETNRKVITNGTFIFLDNLLGELNFATNVDNITVIGKDKAEKELIPIEKLNDFLVWREKEFLEKYDGTWHNTESDKHSILEGTLQNGNPLLAVVNMDLLKWESKASHPWILTVEIKYKPDPNGLPNNKTVEDLNEMEDFLLDELKDSEGYLNIGRETADGVREFYFACKDFRKPPKAAEKLMTLYQNKYPISFDMYKDKYWQSFNRYTVTKFVKLKMHKIFKSIFLLYLLFNISYFCNAQIQIFDSLSVDSTTFVNTKNKINQLNTENFKKQKFTQQQSELPYRLLLPKNYNQSQKYPLVITFHNSSRIGSDNEKQLEPLAKIWFRPEIYDNYPCFVIAPQFNKRSSNYTKQADGILSSIPSDDVNLVLKLIDSISLKYGNIDKSRIYLVGYSMGASTAQNLMTMDAKKFAAIVSIAAVPDFSNLRSFKNKNMLLIHGQNDTENPYNGSVELAKKLKNNKKLIFKTYINLNHDNINIPFLLSDEIPKWLFQQKK